MTNEEKPSPREPAMNLPGFRRVKTRTNPVMIDGGSTALQQAIVHELFLSLLLFYGETSNRCQRILARKTCVCSLSPSPFLVSLSLSLSLTPIDQTENMDESREELNRTGIWLGMKYFSEKEGKKREKDLASRKRRLLMFVSIQMTKTIVQRRCQGKLFVSFPDKWVLTESEKNRAMLSLRMNETMSSREKWLDEQPRLDSTW